MDGLRVWYIWGRGMVRSEFIRGAKPSPGAVTAALGQGFVFDTDDSWAVVVEAADIDDAVRDDPVILGYAPGPKINWPDTPDGWRLRLAGDPREVSLVNPVFGTQLVEHQWGGWRWVNRDGDEYHTDGVGEGLAVLKNGAWQQMEGTMQFRLPPDRAAAIRKLRWYAVQGGKPWIMPSKAEANNA